MSVDVRASVAAMAGYVPGEQPQGGKFIKLNTNENPYPPSLRVTRAIEQALQQGLVRYPDPMANAFRIRAGEVLGFDPDWIVCGNGSDDILTMVTRTFVGEGQLLRLPFPSYILYRSLAEIQGAGFEEVRFRDDWTLSEGFSAGREHLKLAFLPNPNSPSGTLLSLEDVRKLARKLSCPLLIDEAYVDFSTHHCLELVREFKHVMVSRSLSKSYALAGLRFGFLVAQPEIIEQLVKVKDSYNCDSLSIAGATAAIDDQDWLVQNRKRVIETRNRLILGLRKLGFLVPESQANFVWGTHTVPVRPLYEQLKSDRILVRYMNYHGWGEGLRISVGTDDQIDACLSALNQRMG